MLRSPPAPAVYLGMTYTDGSGRQIVDATRLATITGPGTLYLVRLSDGSTHLIARTQSTYAAPTTEVYR